MIKCPNAGNQGILKKAKKLIDSKCKKKQQDFTKRKYLATTNYINFYDAGKECIQQQVLNFISIASKMASVASSITGITGATPAPSPAKSDQKRIVFLYDAKAFSSNICRPILPVMIQSIMPRIQLQLGMDINNSSCLGIRCLVDTAAALCTRNYHFFTAFAKWYPQCVAKIFLPENYSPIILSRIVQDNSTAIITNLPMAFQLH